MFIENFGFITFLEKKIKVSNSLSVKTYPSLIHMREIALKTSSSDLSIKGVKKNRRVGNNDEFDHIAQYQVGDDTRTINWKATSKRTELMVNKFDEQKSQQVYMLIDLGRNMMSPFEGMTLIDYSINTILAFTNIILKKRDKPGLITFSNKIHTFIPSSSKRGTLNRFFNYLYKEESTELEPEFENLYRFVRKNIRKRSLLILFTNFSSDHYLMNNIHVLRKLNKFHRLIMISFTNTDMYNASLSTIKSLKHLYQMTSIDKTLSEKNRLKVKMEKHGIQVISTSPKNLSINVVNKFLELKKSGRNY